MGTFSDLHHNGAVIRHKSDFLERIEPRLFDVEWLMAEGHLRGSSTGRGRAHYLSFGGCDMVLRAFRRGGLMGKINRDLYLRTGLHRSRPMQEFDLLNWMHDKGLPVPRALAAKMTPVGPFYRAAIITERILGGTPMEEVLRENALDADVWGAAGVVIRRMHDAGVYHSDLNCRNILIDDDQQVWLIDFDKCNRRAPGLWTSENLDRLRRSLEKEDAKEAGLFWSEKDWNDLLAGYESNVTSNCGA